MTELHLNVALRTGGIPSLQSVPKSSYHASFPHPTEADCRPFQLLPTRPPWLQMLRLPSGRLNHSFMMSRRLNSYKQYPLRRFGLNIILYGIRPHFSGLFRFHDHYTLAKSTGKFSHVLDLNISLSVSNVYLLPCKIQRFPLIFNIHS